MKRVPKMPAIRRMKASAEFPGFTERAGEEMKRQLFAAMNDPEKLGELQMIVQKVSGFQESLDELGLLFDCTPDTLT